MRLYKYRSADDGLEWLSSRRLYFTPPMYFNDPFEILPASRREMTEKEWCSIFRTRRHRDIVRRALRANGTFCGTKKEFKDWYEDHFEEVFPSLLDTARRTMEEVESDFAKLEIGRAHV